MFSGKLIMHLLLRFETNYDLRQIWCVCQSNYIKTLKAIESLMTSEEYRESLLSNLPVAINRTVSL